jgi:hypothetical protein
MIPATTDRSMSRPHDPYWVWAHATQYVDYGGDSLTMIKVIVECKASSRAFAQWATNSSDGVVTVIGASISDASDKYCTALIRRNGLSRIGGLVDGMVGSDPRLIEFWDHVIRCEMALPVLPDGIDAVNAVFEVAPLKISSETDDSSNDEKQKRRVIAVIDGGIGFAHPAFRNTAGDDTRVIAAWDQTSHATKTGSVPTDFRYGVEWRSPHQREMLYAASKSVAAQNAFYRSENVPYVSRRLTHGGAVAEIAAGVRGVRSRLEGMIDDVPARGDTPDYASSAGVLLVNLPKQSIDFTARGAMSAYVLDALHWIIDRAGDNADIVVNLSYGTIAGPHDGSSILECAMDALIERSNGRLQIVLPAGNVYARPQNSKTAGAALRSKDLRCHASIAAQDTGSASVILRLQPDDITPSFVEIWVPPSVPNLSITLKPPGKINAVSVKILAGEHCVDVHYGASIIFPETTANGIGSRLALLAFRPTARGQALHGDWEIELCWGVNSKGQVNLWIERDNVAQPNARRGRQARFILNSGGERNPSLGTLNSYATGKNTVVVGGMRCSDGQEAWYSSAGPTSDSKQLRPDVIAPAEQSSVLHGIRVSGVRGGEQGRMGGTSIAAPLIARWLVNNIPLVHASLTATPARSLVQRLAREVELPASAASTANQSYGGSVKPKQGGGSKPLQDDPIRGAGRVFLRSDNRWRNPTTETAVTSAA